MKILSFAADEETIGNINHFMQQGYKGRSEIVRAGLNALREQSAHQSKLHGDIDAILLVNHPEKHTESLMQLRHAHQQLIQTHLHTHLKDHHCLDLFILRGNAERIKQLTESYQTNKKVANVKLIVS